MVHLSDGAAFLLCCLSLCDVLQVLEQLVSVDELLNADEVFCTGTAVVVSPVGSITYMGER